jgi:hypothetical protein
MPLVSSPPTGPPKRAATERHFVVVLLRHHSKELSNEGLGVLGVDPLSSLTNFLEDRTDGFWVTQLGRIRT